MDVPSKTGRQASMAWYFPSLAAACSSARKDRVSMAQNWAAVTFRVGWKEPSP